MHSVLDEIKGIGPKKRKALMLYFKEIDKIRAAEVSELMEVEGITKSLAEEIYNYFR